MKLTNELIQYIFHLECQLFMKTNSYYIIMEKCNIKCLNFEERNQLQHDINNIFSKLIQIIKKSCPELTNEDILFCCLKKIGLDNSIICHCMGNVNKQAINQRRYRIKRKMKESMCYEIFYLIFFNIYN